MKRTSLINHIFTRFVLKPLAGFIVAGVMLAGPVFASGVASSPVVGEVSFVLGKAFVEKADGTRELISVGTSVNVNDRIETGSNGHVHIRFVDEALVSVRPSSELEILRYDYNAAAPQDSVVKLNLVEGVTRAISGKAAKAARENFRMDTPIAAIGVRGTDFVVSSNQDGVRAQVNEGAIIIAPYSSECSAATFGPCSLNALELAGGANQIVQISANTNEAMLLSLSNPLIPELPAVQSAAPTVVASSEAKTKGEGLYTDSVAFKAVTRGLATRPPLVPPPSPPALAETPEFTPDVIASAETLMNKQLVWGRYDSANPGFERITIPYKIRSADGSAFVINDAIEKDHTVGAGNDVYGLFRKGAGEVQPGLHVLGFNLYQSQAILTANGQSDLMNVTGGTLNIDFDQNLFSTSLQMNHATTGNVEFSESGRVFGEGNFHSSNSNGTPSMSGTVSLDGTQAGYLFKKILEAGVIEGLTLWGVKP